MFFKFVRYFQILPKQRNFYFIFRKILQIKCEKPIICSLLEVTKSEFEENFRNLVSSSCLVNLVPPRPYMHKREGVSTPPTPPKPAKKCIGWVEKREKKERKGEKIRQK